jgi:large repetitive protein
MKKLIFYFSMLGILISTIQNTNAQSAPNDTTFVIIHKLPAQVTLTRSRDTVYVGQSVTLQVTNCTGTVNWNTGLTSSSITVSPTTTKYYVAQCTSSSGCKGPKDSLQVAVKSLTTPVGTTPTQTDVTNPSICAGENATLRATSSCIGGTVTWSNGSTGSIITVSPSSSTSYTYTCTFANAGASNASPAITVTVRPLPIAPTLSATLSNITTGQSSMITASGCAGTVTWSNGAIGGSITVSPTVPSTYTAYCTLSGCVGPTASQMISVNSPIPSIALSSSSICQGDPLTITASGCTAGGTYRWSTGQTTAAITTNPTADLYLEVLCRDSAGDSAPRKIKLKLSN